MRWDYAYFNSGRGDIGQMVDLTYHKANEYGADGWEMVSFTVVAIGGGDINGSVYSMYKRPVG